MLDITHHDGIAVIEMNRPPANAINAEFMTRLNQTFIDETESDSRAIVLTGSGSIFSAGVDLLELVKGGTPYVREFLNNLERMLTTLFFYPKPVVAAINGHAIAGGCVIASCADDRIMIDGKAKIGVPELHVGVPFPVNIMELMRAKVKKSAFEQIMLGGAVYSADQAKDNGLVDTITAVDELLDTAIKSAQSLASIRADVYALTKSQIRQPVRDAVEKNSKLYSAQINELWLSDATQQAIKAYMEKTFKK